MSAHIEAHESHHRPEPDLLDKGLQHDSVGLLASILLSVSSVAPAYALTATFTWTVKAFGPHIGWMCGWSSPAAPTWRPGATASSPRATCLAFVALAPWVAYRGMMSDATLLSGIGTAIFYAVMTLVSENVLVDTILSLGLMICFYYGLTAFAATWYFPRELTRGVRELLLKGVAPVLGGLTLAAVFVKLAVDTIDPEYGSGGSIFGLGTVFVLGIGPLALGLVVMFAWQAREPAFFRGETLKHDTPALIVEE